MFWSVSNVLSSIIYQFPISALNFILSHAVLKQQDIPETAGSLRHQFDPVSFHWANPAPDL